MLRAEKLWTSYIDSVKKTILVFFYSPHKVTRNWKRFFPLLKVPELFDICDTWCCCSLSDKVTRKGFDVGSLTLVIVVVAIVIAECYRFRRKDPRRVGITGVYHKCVDKPSRGELKAKNRVPHRSVPRVLWPARYTDACYIPRRFISRTLIAVSSPEKRPIPSACRPHLLGMPRVFICRHERLP